MTNVKWPNVFIIVALVLAALGLIMPQAQTAAPVVAPQAFQCGAGTMCVQDAGKTVTFLSGSSLTINSGASFSYPYRGASTVTTTTSIAHGLTTTPTVILTGGPATVTISSLGATTFTAAAATTSTVYWLAIP